MSDRAKDLLPLLTILTKVKPRQRKALLGMCSNDQVRAMEEIALNIVKNTTPLSRHQEEVCRKWKKPLKLIALKRHPLKKKKNILQKGGFIGALLPIFASVLGTVLANG